MYRPPHFALDEPGALELIRAHALAQLVVVANGVPIATPVPMIARGDTFIGHLARPNPVLQHPGAALAIFAAADAYVSPRWYEDKRTSGKVVPTWNYSTVQVSGTLVVRDEPDFTLGVVTELSSHFEAAYDAPWAVADAPSAYVAKLLRGIVAFELVGVTITGKAKLSQNRGRTDQTAIADGLAARSNGDAAAATAIRAALVD